MVGKGVHITEEQAAELEKQGKIPPRRPEPITNEDLARIDRMLAEQANRVTAAVQPILQSGPGVSPFLIAFIGFAIGWLVGFAFGLAYVTPPHIRI